MDTGDYLIDHAVVVERKTAPDFARSLIDGRLFTQARRLVRTPARAVVILEGDARQWNKVGVSREAIQGALISLMIIFDLPVLRSCSPRESAQLIQYTGLQLLRTRSEEQIPCRQLKAKRRSTRRQQVLQALPGVGPDRARRLLDHFGSVRNCLAADEAALTQVEGIGPTTAQAILHTVEEPTSPYQKNSPSLPPSPISNLKSQIPSPSQISNLKS